MKIGTKAPPRRKSVGSRRGSRNRIKTAAPRKASNGRKPIRIALPSGVLKLHGPATGSKAIVLTSGRQSQAVVTRVHAQGRRLIAELLDGAIRVRHLCFAKARDGSYQLAGSRHPRSTRLYVP